MNKILEYNVNGQSIELASAAMLVAGTVNEYTARFAFGADWDGYQRLAVFNADGTEREQLLTDDACKVPWEVLKPGAYLKVGVYGTKDGSRLPTIWTSHRQYIHDGAGPTEEAADPSPVLAEQILQRMGDIDHLKTEDKSSLVAAVNEVKETGGGGTADHSKLKNRDAADQHPMSAITGLQVALDGKQPVGSYITEESDPTVPSWAKQPQKPAYTAQEVGALPNTTAIPSTAADVNAEPSGAVSQHNVSDDAHSDIRLLIQGLSERLSAVADSDDTTLDQLSEIVAYIKSNRDLISAITTNKVSVSDIVDNLTTNVANKPLSAAQGVAIKALIDALSNSMTAYRTAAAQDVIDSGKVDKVAGKGLSSNDYTDVAKAKVDALAPVATSGSYDDLTDKPSIPDAVTEGTVSGWGFTKNTGTYSKPTGGIPKADLANDVQASLGKADTALQEHQNLAAYRTAAEQNIIDNGKQDKITSTNKLAYSLISDAPTIPTVPTNVSAFTNDAGYLTFATLPKYEGVVE